ncbi:hypothetical protein ALIPUT_01732 [Alistipes putredinis DSM 17216]|uniref:Uncharacterized protein n=2 Tax=Alistipes putredinis TaxID=28117 RepID=B0MWZ6_9BACT|nr:hypothetical protein ALIPUT_01732 [Alistipes putredinis DSM 17216]
MRNNYAKLQKKCKSFPPDRFFSPAESPRASKAVKIYIFVPT